ncbi:Signal transduction histidine kinase [Streptomyces sp. yr375]|uniref:sensor histidine kinase n=1 Tax=Streptomyces sp. yr375 TaxID=1761906 RepID=UPI0008C4E0FA|nr:ATP-binding protein [Streptomyces sp. yr375]SES27396.1 Signal transduction histidine kinase [Streptomyces sp. yr375]
MLKTHSAFTAEAHRAAALLETHSPRIRAAFEAELRAGDHALARDPVTLDQELTHADRTTADVVLSLRSGRVRTDRSHRPAIRADGARRAAQGIHPQESLTASALLHTVLLREASALVASFARPLPLINLIASALHQSISFRVDEALESYTALLVETVHEAQVKEQSRIARELHDRIGHGVSTAYRNIELFGIHQKSDPEKANARVEKARLAIRSTIKELRALTSDLHTGEISRNLEKSLVHYLEAADCDGVDVHLQISGDEGWARPEVLDEVFLMVREASHNALRHAGARVVLIRVTVTPHELRASVRDDGCGFDARRHEDTDGLGLSCMRERAGLLGGTAVINSRIGLGTVVEFAIPLKEVPAL